jgi:hypothetical protein
MSFEKFFERIDRSWLGSFVSRKREIVENTDPGRIYVENVRAFFSVPYGVARAMCDLAVREGSFVRVFAAHCPTCDRTIATFATKDAIPAELECDHCEIEGREPWRFPRSAVFAQPVYALSQSEFQDEGSVHIG